MLDQAFLEALRDGYWPLYLVAVCAGVLRFVVDRQWCMGRAVFALATASIGQYLWEGDGYLLWWQHLALNLWVFLLITTPPRHYWQSTLGALVLCQMVLNAIWFAVPDLAREHWFANVLLGYAQCFVLLLWSGGARVERVLARGAGALARLVRPASRRKLA